MLTSSSTPGGAEAMRSHGSESYISARNVTVAYATRGAKRGRNGDKGGGPATTLALTDVSIDIHQGEFVALVGATGCGKTTLLNMVAGLVTPTEGRLEIDGVPARANNLDIGYMFARDALMPWRNVLRNVELGMEARGQSRSARRVRAREMLEIVGLADRERAYPLHLSQGMRQRAALARTLAIRPSILLMDEPFAALDARTRLGMQSEFLRIWESQTAENRKTVIFVTHDLQEATLLADRVVVMLPSPGRIANVIPIDLPRPRADVLGEMVFDEKFREIEHQLFELLEGARHGSSLAAGGAR